MVKVLMVLALSILLPGNLPSALDKGEDVPRGLDPVLTFLDQDPCTRECAFDPPT